MKKTVFWDVMPCGSCKNRRFRRTCHMHLLLITSNVLPSSLILVTLMMEALRSSEESVLTRSIRRHVSEDGILYIYHRENLKSYIALNCWAL
jgi:hypothetical protein